MACWSPWYRDADGDGYGKSCAIYFFLFPARRLCAEQYRLYDGNATINPGALEVQEMVLTMIATGLVDEDCGPTPVIYIAGTAIVEGNQGNRPFSWLC